MKLKNSQIKNKIQELGPWYHNININGIETSPGGSEQSKRWSLLEPYLPQDLSNKTVLDLGCNAGYFSIKLKERGALVKGVDWFPKAIEQAKFVAETLGHEIEYETQNIYKFLLTNKTSYDYVLFLGLFYHLRYPLLALDKIAEITKEGLLFQTVIYNEQSFINSELEVPENLNSSEQKIFRHRKFPKLYFIEKKYNSVKNNWFICNKEAVLAILRSSGFQIENTNKDSFFCKPLPRNKANYYQDIFTLCPER